jgi:hypothetical protein
MLSDAYAHEVVPVLEPFVEGYIDSQNIRDEVLETLGYGYTDLSLEDILARDSSLRYDYAVECMKIVGIYQDRAEEMAQKAVDLADRSGVSMTDAVVTVLCDTGSFVGGLLVGATVVAIPRAIFMGNSGGAFDNAKKYIESGAIPGHGKGTAAHKAAVTGDTVGDTRKDVVGVALDIFIKTMSTVANTLVSVFKVFTLIK